MKKVILLLTILVLTASCTTNYLTKQTESLPFEVLQFGSTLFFKNKKKNIKIRNARKVVKVSSGLWIYPKKRCVKVTNNHRVYKVCLKDYPSICPHAYLDEVNSAEVRVRILSIFNKIAIFVEKGRKGLPDPTKIKVVSPGVFKIKNPDLGATYNIVGAIIFGKNFFGPLCSLLKVKVKDKIPPLPPSGGGYIVKNGKLCIMWEKSPSEDVVSYEVVAGKKQYFTNSTELSISFSKELKKIEVFAIDRAGNKSKALTLSIKEEGGE